MKQLLKHILALALLLFVATGARADYTNNYDGYSRYTIEGYKHSVGGNCAYWAAAGSNWHWYSSSGLDGDDHKLRLRHDDGDYAYFPLSTFHARGYTIFQITYAFTFTNNNYFTINYGGNTYNATTSGGDNDNVSSDYSKSVSKGSDNYLKFTVPNYGVTFDHIYIYYYRPTFHYAYNTTLTNVSDIYFQTEAAIDFGVYINLTAGKLTTVCYPTAVTQADLGNPTKVWSMTRVDGDRVVFTQVTGSLAAGKPYVVLPSQNKSGYVYKKNQTMNQNTTKTPGNTSTSYAGNTYTFQGNYGRTPLPQDGTCKYFRSDMNTATEINGLHGYWQLPTQAAARAITFVEEEPDGSFTPLPGFGPGETTPIASVKADGVTRPGDALRTNIYDISGAQSNANAARLTRGIYIKEGRKFFVR